jgi:hypothetical protein
MELPPLSLFKSNQLLALAVGLLNIGLLSYCFFS